MISLNDVQLANRNDRGRHAGPRTRAVFLERVGAMLKLKGRFSDDDVADVVSLALCGLIHRTDAA
jgi:hypothetical protein